MPKVKSEEKSKTLAWRKNRKLRCLKQKTKNESSRNEDAIRHEKEKFFHTAKKDRKTFMMKMQLGMRKQSAAILPKKNQKCRQKKENSECFA